MYRAFTRCLQIMLGTQGTSANPILPIIAPQQVLVLPSEQVKESQNYKETKKKKKKEIAKFVIWDF